MLNKPRCLFSALGGGFIAFSMATPVPAAAQAEQAPPQETERLAEEAEPLAPEDFDALARALLGDDAQARIDARSALLLYPMADDEQVRLLSLCQDTEQLIRAREVLQHHVLTQLREEEFADADPEGVVVGFRFVCRATSGLVQEIDADVASQYAWGAQISSTTPGFPGSAYLRVDDAVVALNGEALPEGTLDAQNFLVNTVSNHEAGQTIEMTVLRDGEVLVMDVPLVRREAMEKMYASQVAGMELLDPFLFLWEEAWATLLFEADREALAQRLEKEDDTDFGRPSVRPLPIRPAGGR